MDKLSEFCFLMSEAPAIEVSPKVAKRFAKIGKLKSWNLKRLHLYDLREELRNGQAFSSGFVILNVSQALTMKKDKNGKVSLPTDTQD